MNMNSRNIRAGNPRDENGNRSNAGNVDLVNLIRNNASKILRKETDRDGEMLFAYAEKVGRRVKDDEVTTSQIRKIFSEVRKLEYDEDGEYRYRLRILKAQIGYTAGRFSKLRNFRDIFNILIDETLRGGEEELKRFKDFFEAVVAYHRAYGGSQ